MDRGLSVVLLAVGVLLMINTCQSAPVSNEVGLLTQLLRKVNIVLDNVIEKQRAEKAKQDVQLELDQRNEDGSRPEIESAVHANEEEIPAAERSVRDPDAVDEQLKEIMRRNEDGDIPFKRLQVSEPEPTPEADDSDISLSKVLKYLQHLRNIHHSKHESD